MSESPAYILYIKRKASYFSADNNSVIQNEKKKKKMHRSQYSPRVSIGLFQPGSPRLAYDTILYSVEDESLYFHGLMPTT